MDVEQPLAESGDRHTTAVGRATLLKRVAITLGGIAAGGAAAAGFAEASRTSHHDDSSLSARDREILELALKLERLQVAFYSEAIRRGKLSGEAKQFAQVVGHEEHEQFLVQAKEPPQQDETGIAPMMLQEPGVELPQNFRHEPRVFLLLLDE